MSKIPSTITTISKFAEWVEQVSNLGTQSEREAIWFRGVGNSTYKLLPGLYRIESGLNRDSDDELRVEFSRRAMPLVAGRTPRDKWKWPCFDATRSSSYFRLDRRGFGGPFTLRWMLGELTALAAVRK